MQPILPLATFPSFGARPVKRRASSDIVQSPFETYLQEINKTPLLTADQEKDLARKIADGDMEARDHMVRANLRLVVNIARHYTGKGLALQDLVEEGNLGLLRAIEGFDPDRNLRFSTYASYWIKQSIKRGLINQGKTIRIPAYMVELLSKWRRATNKLNDELGRPPTHEEVAKFMGLPRKKLSIIKQALKALSGGLQTRSNSSDPAESSALDELLPGNGALLDERVIGREELSQLQPLLEKMDKREATVLRLRFGLDNEEPKTLKEVGEVLGLTRERVRQIEAEALGKLGDRFDQSESTRPFVKGAVEHNGELDDRPLPSVRTETRPYFVALHDSPILSAIAKKVFAEVGIVKNVLYHLFPDQAQVLYFRHKKNPFEYAQIAEIFEKNEDDIKQTERDALDRISRQIRLSKGKRLPVTVIDPYPPIIERRFEFLRLQKPGILKKLADQVGREPTKVAQAIPKLDSDQATVLGMLNKTPASKLYEVAEAIGKPKTTVKKIKNQA